MSRKQTTNFFFFYYYYYFFFFEGFYFQENYIWKTSILKTNILSNYKLIVNHKQTTNCKWITSKLQTIFFFFFFFFFEGQILTNNNTHTTFLSCLRSLLVNSASISRNGRFGGGAAGSRGGRASPGCTANRMPSLWRAVMASLFLTASRPKERANRLASSCDKWGGWESTNDATEYIFR